MRVVMVTSNFPETPETPVGGVAAVCACLAQALVKAREDIDLHVVHYPAPRAFRNEKRGSPSYTLHGLIGSRWSNYDPTGSWMRSRVSRILKELQPDVVHIQNHASLFDPSRQPALLTIHGITERDTYLRARRLKRTRTFLVKLRESAYRSSYPITIAIADYVIQQLQEDAKAKAHLIHNPIQDHFFDAANCPGDAPPTVLQVGVLIPRKNALASIEAIGILNKRGVDCRLRLAGPPKDPLYTQELHDAVDRLGIQKHVDFLGAISQSDVAEELRSCRVLALPSYQETAPMTISEASAMGLPCVVSAAGGSAEMVAHGRSGFVIDPDNPTDMADALQPLLEDPSKANEMGLQAREFAGRYRAQHVAEQTLALYDKLQSDSAHA